MATIRLICLVCFMLMPSVSGQWWNDNYPCAKNITIVKVSTNMTDYPVKMTVSYASGMNVRFNDLRFVNSSGSELSYYTDSYTASSSALVFVKMPRVLTDANQTITMYYCNSTAVNKSIGDNVFSAFDHFNGNALNTTKWYQKAGCTTSTGGSVFAFQYSDSCRGQTDQLDIKGVKWKLSNFTYMNYQVTARMTGSTGGSRLGELWTPIIAGFGQIFSQNAVSNYRLEIYNGSNTYSDGGGYASNNYEVLTLKKFNSTRINAFYSTAETSFLSVTRPGTYMNNNGRYGFQNDQNDNTLYIDYFFVRKTQYPNAEPTVAFSSNFNYTFPQCDFVATGLWNYKRGTECVMTTSVIKTADDLSVNNGTLIVDNCTVYFSAGSQKAVIHSNSKLLTRNGGRIIGGLPAGGGMKMVLPPESDKYKWDEEVYKPKDPKDDVFIEENKVCVTNKTKYKNGTYVKICP